MEKAKTKDMTKEQIAHTFCTWCGYRLLVAGNTYWGCRLEDDKKEDLCLYRKEVQKEEKTK
ncbi:MAG: hypothetical protein ACOY4I_06870 [Bacillota bacterium]